MESVWILNILVLFHWLQHKYLENFRKELWHYTDQGGAGVGGGTWISKWGKCTFSMHKIEVVEELFKHYRRWLLTYLRTSGGTVGGTLADGRASVEKLLTSSNDAVLWSLKSIIDCSWTQSDDLLWNFMHKSCYCQKHACLVLQWKASACTLVCP